MTYAKYKSAILTNLMGAAAAAHRAHSIKEPTRVNAKRRQAVCGEALCFYIRKARSQARML